MGWTIQGSFPGREVFLLSKRPLPALGPTQLTYSVPRVLSPGVEQQGSEVNYCPPSGKVKNL